MDTATQPTIWEVPDDVGALVEPILNDCYPAKPKGHRRVDRRRVLNGIIFRLRTGCQWHQLPKQLGDDSTVHRHFQQWGPRGLFAPIGAVLVEACDVLGGVELAVASRRRGHGQGADGRRVGGPQPHRPWEKGVKRRLVVEADGGPLGAAMAGANVHDPKLLAATLEAIVVVRPQPTEEASQHLCLDKG